MTLSFRELTNQECLLNREMSHDESKRTALEQSVLAGLGDALQRFKGPIKQCPAGAMSEHNPELNSHCKKRREDASKGGNASVIAKRQKASGVVK